MWGAISTSEDSSAKVAANDKQGRLTLCKYILRPPLANNPQGHCLRRPEPLALIARLAALVPPPQRNTVRYFCVLSSHAASRSEVFPSRRFRRECAGVDCASCSTLAFRQANHSLAALSRRVQGCGGAGGTGSRTEITPFDLAMHCAGNIYLGICVDVPCGLHRRKDALSQDDQNDEDNCPHRDFQKTAAQLAQEFGCLHRRCWHRA